METRLCGVLSGAVGEDEMRMIDVGDNLGACQEASKHCVSGMEVKYSSSLGLDWYYS